jgi:hypothetical protein
MIIAFAKQINLFVQTHDDTLTGIATMKQTGEPACFMPRQMHRTATVHLA